MMTCPACGTQPWHIVKGACQSCGHQVNQPISQNREVTL